MKHRYAQTREELLLSLINRTEPKAVDAIGCTYSHKFNGGCAIGCQVNSKLAEELEKCGGSVLHIFDMLPKRMQNMGPKFLEDVQIVHDKHFGEDDFNKKINQIITNYNLDIPLLEI